MIEGAKTKKKALDAQEIKKIIQKKLLEGKKLKDIAQSLAEEFSLSKNLVYQLGLEVKKETRG